MKRKVLVILLFLTLMVGFGCEKEEETEVGTTATVTDDATLEDVDTSTPVESKTATITVNVSYTAAVTESLRNALGTTSDIDSITVEMIDPTDDTVLKTTDLQSINGIWQGVIEEVPYDKSLKFLANAYNSDSVKIFTGWVDKTLTEGADNNLSILISSIDDGVAPTNPSIMSATLPEKLLTDSEAQAISFAISHTSKVAYQVTVSEGKVAKTATDVPAESVSGEHDPSANLELYYFSASTAGTVTVTITVNDLDDSDTVSATYSISVIAYDPDTWTDSGVTVVVGPTISGMEFNRSESTLSVKLLADSDSTLTYAWSGTESFASIGEDETSNPLFIYDFTDDMAGVISVTVTDESGLYASVERTIAANDFPYLADTYPANMKGYYIYDKVTNILWEDNLNYVKRNWDDANTYCASLKIIDYTSDWRLPTQSELSSMFLRSGDLSKVYPENYWSSDEVVWWPYDVKAKSVSFYGGWVSTDKKNWHRLVRCVRD